MGLDVLLQVLVRTLNGKHTQKVLKVTFLLHLDSCEVNMQLHLLSLRA